LLTAGDARFAPDRPVPCGRVLGTVVAVHIGGEWQPVGPPTVVSWYHRLVRAITLPITIATLWLGVPAAHRLADVLLTLETYSRLALRRLRLRRRGAPGPRAPADVGHGG
jgi:hypothetical protein